MNSNVPDRKRRGACMSDMDVDDRADTPEPLLSPYSPPYSEYLRERAAVEALDASDNQVYNRCLRYADPKSYQVTWNGSLRSTQQAQLHEAWPLAHENSENTDMQEEHKLHRQAVGAHPQARSKRGSVHDAHTGARPDAKRRCDGPLGPLSVY